MLKLSDFHSERNGFIYRIGTSPQSMDLFIARDSNIPSWHWRMSGLTYQYLPPDYIVKLNHFETSQEALDDYLRFRTLLLSVSFNDLRKIAHHVNGIEWTDYIYELNDTEAIYIVPDKNSTWQWGIDFYDDARTSWSSDKKHSPWFYETPQAALEGLIADLCVQDIEEEKGTNT